MNELALFAGAGGGILGGKLCGWRTVCAVELNDYCRGVLMRRQDDGVLEPFPVWDDVRTFDGNPWRGVVDIITGGFPCQDISAAGKGAGIDGEKSGLWKEMARIIGEVGPRYVLVENSPLLIQRGLGRVLGDLAAMGYDARWGVLGADAASYPHHRARIWVAAHSQRSERRQQQHNGENRRMGRKLEPAPWDRDWVSVFAGVRGNGDGMAHRLDRTDAIRNGQVPAVVRLAWHFLNDEPETVNEIQNDQAEASGA